MRRARNAPAAEAADDVEQSYQDEALAPAPRRRGRGRGRGRPRMAQAQEVEQEPVVEPEVPQVDPAVFAAGMAGINQGLAALNQAMPLVQQMLQQRNQEMTDAEAATLYTRVGRVLYDGTGDAMDFINTIEARTRTGYNDYQRLMVVELSLQAAAQDWFTQSIRPFMPTMTWLEFKEQFMRFFCPSSMRENYRWQLMHLVRGDRSVDEFTREFLRLGRFAPDVMHDEDRATELYVIGLGSAYVSIRPGGRTLHSVIEEARQLERRYTMYSTVPDPYASGSSRGVVPQGVQQPVFQLGSTGTQIVTSQQQRTPRMHRVGRHNRRPSRSNNRFGARASSSSGQSSGYGSTGSGPSACQNCGRVHQGPCHLTPGACFKCGQTGHFARACPYSGYQQAYPQSSSVAQSAIQPQFYPLQSSGQYGGQQGRGSVVRPVGRPSGRGLVQPSTSQAGRGQARVFTLTPQEVPASDDVVAGILLMYSIESCLILAHHILLFYLLLHQQSNGNYLECYLP